MDDQVQIRCTRCKTVFRERARRMQNGFSRQCPSCEVVLFFEEDSPDQNMKRAMKTARKVRKDLREAEAAQITTSPSSSRRGTRGHGGRQEAAEEEEGG
jgi:predicted  nucleic acid-binding Zn-ribbon protein